MLSIICCDILVGGDSAKAFYLKRAKQPDTLQPLRLERFCFSVLCALLKEFGQLRRVLMHLHCIAKHQHQLAVKYCKRMVGMSLQRINVCWKYVVVCILTQGIYFLRTVSPLVIDFQQESFYRIVSQRL